MAGHLVVRATFLSYFLLKPDAERVVFPVLTHLSSAGAVSPRGAASTAARSPPGHLRAAQQAHGPGVSPTRGTAVCPASTAEVRVDPPRGSPARRSPRAARHGPLCSHTPGLGEGRVTEVKDESPAGPLCRQACTPTRPHPPTRLLPHRPPTTGSVCTPHRPCRDTARLPLPRRHLYTPTSSPRRQPQDGGGGFQGHRGVAQPSAPALPPKASTLTPVSQEASGPTAGTPATHVGSDQPGHAGGLRGSTCAQAPAPPRCAPSVGRRAAGPELRDPFHTFPRLHRRAPCALGSGAVTGFAVITGHSPWGVAVRA